jgi:hypothetical protein
LLAAVEVVFLVGCLIAQVAPFAGLLAGVGALSADGRSITTGTRSAVSLYKPENGPAYNLFGGVHLTGFLSIQGNYIWNRNDLTLTASQVSESGSAFYEQSQTSSQHAAIGDVLLYFRNRQTWFRPYLSVGSGFVFLESRETRVLASQGNPSLPEQQFESTRPALRVAVGIDFRLAAGWALRYSFSETIRRNAISEQLSPPGQRNLANFQNLFGIVKQF